MSGGPLVFNLCLHHTGAWNSGASLLVLHPDNRGAESPGQFCIPELAPDRDRARGSGLAAHNLTSIYSEGERVSAGRGLSPDLVYS